MIHEGVISLEMGNKTEREKATNSSAKNPAVQTDTSTDLRKLQEQHVQDMNTTQIPKSQQTTGVGKGEEETSIWAKGIPSICDRSAILIVLA